MSTIVTSTAATGSTYTTVASNAGSGTLSSAVSTTAVSTTAISTRVSRLADSGTISSPSTSTLLNEIKELKMHLESKITEFKEEVQQAQRDAVAEAVSRVLSNFLPPEEEKPYEEYYCPVTRDPLLQPHLTACCGQHLSEKAAEKIKGACPLCKDPQFRTMLDKKFRREVNELHVFCCQRGKGCTWEGKLSERESHDQSCPMKATPDLPKLPIYNDGQITSGNPQGRPKVPLTVQCHKKNTAPCEMARGSATTDDHFAYFQPEDSDLVYRYELSADKWERLTPTMYTNSGLINMGGVLTAVGGQDGPCRINKLYKLQEDRWLEHFPSMDTTHSNSAFVSTADGNYIFAIGGEISDLDWTATVKMLDVTTKIWYDLTNLPQALIEPSATICNYKLHVIGRNGNGYTCSLNALLSSDKPMTSQSLSNILNWKPLPLQPVKCSTAATLCEELVIVGGKRGWTRDKFIYQLLNGSWVKIGSMSSGRWRCLVVTPSPNKMVIVGGHGGRDSVEELEVVFPPENCSS